MVHVHQAFSTFIFQCSCAFGLRNVFSAMPVPSVLLSALYDLRMVLQKQLGGREQGRGQEGDGSKSD